MLCLNLSNLFCLDFKNNIAVRDNLDARQFSLDMQCRVLCLLSQFYARNQGNSDILDDFFTFASKHVAAASSRDIYRGILKAEMEKV